MYGSFRKRVRPIWSELRRNYAVFKRGRSKATFIAITGSSAKTTTTALLSHILSGVGKVKTQLIQNYPDATWKTLGGVKREHDYVVLEVGTSAPGNIQRMARVVRPDIAIVTIVGQEHYSAFRSKDAVAEEKGSLIKAQAHDGIAILNKDDPHVLAMSKLAKGRVVTFGNSAADYSKHNLISNEPGSLAFTINFGGRQIRLKTRLTGAHNYLAVLAAAACALELGVPEQKVIQRIASFKPVFARLSVHTIEGGPTFIVDTHKAPYESIPLVFDVLRDCTAPRKRFVLGTISDYPGNSTPKYRNTYRAALNVADQVMFVGENANKSKATDEEIAAGKFIALSSVKQLSDYIKSTAVPGEIILLKGSGNLHLERIMLDWTTEVKCWPDKCGVATGCYMCGQYNIPFFEHLAQANKFKWGGWEWDPVVSRRVKRRQNFHQDTIGS